MHLAVDHGSEDAYDWVPREELLVINQPREGQITGIHTARQDIVDIARDIGETKLVFADDDLRFFTRDNLKDPESTKLKISTNENIQEMMGSIDNALNIFAMVGISARQGNNNLDLFSQNSRIIRMFGLNLWEIPETIRFDRLRVMEDFDFQLQLLRKGLDTVNLASYAQDQQMTGAPGGCSTYRDHLVQHASAVTLQEFHPDYVSLRQKNNKTGGAFGHRTEVTIQWKKAREEGSR